MKRYAISYRTLGHTIAPHYPDNVTFYAEIRGETEREAMKRLVEIEKPRARVVKIERVKEV